jgi:hypothetical protein
LRAHCQPIKAVQRDLRHGAKASTPLAPFGSTGVERTGLNVFGVFSGVPAVLVGGDHVVSGSQASQMARCAKSASGCAFIRRRSAASYRQQVARASDSEGCSDKTSSVASRNADHFDVTGLKATPKNAELAPRERCLSNLRCCMTVSIDWVQLCIAS